MLGKVLIPVAAALLLAGCVTPAQYRGGTAGGYYSAPAVRTVPYGTVGYGTRGGFYGSVGVGARYGYPYGVYPGYGSYGYYGPYGGYGYPGFYGGPRYVGYPYGVHPRPGVNPPRQHPRQSRPAPWRDMPRYANPRGNAQAAPQRAPTPMAAPASAPRPASAPASRVQAPRAQSGQRGGALRSVYGDRTRVVEP